MLLDVVNNLTLNQDMVVTASWVQLNHADRFSYLFLPKAVTDEI